MPSRANTSRLIAILSLSLSAVLLCLLLASCSPGLGRVGNIYMAKFSYNETALKYAKPSWLNVTIADTLNVTGFPPLEIRVGFGGFCAAQANSHLCATTTAGLVASKEFLDPMNIFGVADKYGESLSSHPHQLIVVVNLISAISLTIDPVWRTLFPTTGQIPRTLSSVFCVCISISMTSLAIVAAAIFRLDPIWPIGLVLNAAGLPVHLNGGIGGFLVAFIPSFLLFLAVGSLCYLLFLEVFVISIPYPGNATQLSHMHQNWEDGKNDSAIDVTGFPMIEFDNEQALGSSPHVVRVLDGIVYLAIVTNGTADGLPGQYRAEEAYYAQRAVELSVERGDIVQIIMRDQGSGAVLARREADSTIGFINKSILTNIHKLDDPFDDSFSTEKTL